MQRNELITAVDSETMVLANRSMIDTMNRNISVCLKDARRMMHEFLIAKKNGWKITNHKAHVRKQLKQARYYQKIRQALELGYSVIPNLTGVEYIAIRRKGKRLPRKQTTSYSWSRIDPLKPSQSKKGVGDYFDPWPYFDRHVVGNDKYGKPNKWELRPNKMNDIIEFPARLAHPVMMEVTKKAMDHKLFDRVGVLPARRSADPLVIGEIECSAGYNAKKLSFIIGWCIDPKTI